MSEIDGWLLQVTSGDPREGEQQVEMYAAWETSEDAAAALVASTFSLADDQLVAVVDTLPAATLTQLGLSPGQACRFVEEAVAD